MYSLVVCDDEYIVIEGIRKMIARLDLEYEIVGFAYDGLTALTVIEEKRPDVVISDIRMPGLDGLTLIEKAKEASPGSEFIVISGFAEFEYARKALLLGVRDYVEKPISMEKLKEVLDKVSTEFLKVREETDAEKKRYAGFEKIEANLKAGMSFITKGDADNFHKNSEDMWANLTSLYEDIEDLKRESYKVLCVFCDILSDGNSDVHREELVAFKEVNKILEINALKTYYRNVVSKIGQYLEKNRSGSSHKTILIILDYINEHYNEDIGLNELADMVNMNPAYLSTLFKYEVGMSYVKYITDFRIKKAKKLLSEGHKVADVANMVGYYNYRYFGDIFKKHVGVSPNEYKGSIRRKA